MVYELELTKDPKTGETTVTNVTYTPFLMLNRGEGADERFVLLDCHQALKDHANGNPESLTEEQAAKVQTAIDDCRAILGAEADING